MQKTAILSILLSYLTLLTLISCSDATCFDDELSTGFGISTYESNPGFGCQVIDGTYYITTSFDIAGRFAYTFTNFLLPPNAEFFIDAGDSVCWQVPNHICEDTHDEAQETLTEEIKYMSAGPEGNERAWGLWYSFSDAPFCNEYNHCFKLCDQANASSRCAIVLKSPKEQYVGQYYNLSFHIPEGEFSAECLPNKDTLICSPCDSSPKDAPCEDLYRDNMNYYSVWVGIRGEDLPSWHPWYTKYIQHKESNDCQAYIGDTHHPDAGSKSSEFVYAQ